MDYLAQVENRKNYPNGCLGKGYWIKKFEFKNVLKTVAFIAGKKNPAIQKNFICFSIENFIENISLYALSWPKLNFGCYLTFEIIFKALFQRKKE